MFPNDGTFAPCRSLDVLGSHHLGPCIMSPCWNPPCHPVPPLPSVSPLLRAGMQLLCSNILKFLLKKRFSLLGSVLFRVPCTVSLSDDGKNEFSVFSRTRSALPVSLVFTIASSLHEQPSPTSLYPSTIPLIFISCQFSSLLFPALCPLLSPPASPSHRANTPLH